MKVAAKFLIVFMILALTSCAYVTQLKQDWKALKSDEKARIVCEFLQSELETTFDTAKAYVATKPEYQADWKAKVVPSFSVANKALAGYMIQAKEGKVTFIDVVKKMTPLLQPILTTLGAWGIDVTNISKFTSIIGG